MVVEVTTAPLALDLEATANPVLEVDSALVVVVVTTAPLALDLEATDSLVLEVD